LQEKIVVSREKQKKEIEGQDKRKDNEGKDRFPFSRE
jgi:hypothetical protein